MWEPLELKRVSSEDEFEDTVIYSADENYSFEEQNVSSNYDEEAALLVHQGRDGRPKGMGILVESKLESEQQFAEGAEAHHTSNFSTMMHLLKGNIGTGILAMPNAVSNAGLMVGTIGIPILGIFCVHCMHLLVISSRTLAARIGCVSLDYTATAENAFALGPRRIRQFAPAARFAVNAMLMLTQFGFCCVYFLFVSKSLYEVIDSLHGSSPVTTTEIMLILLPVMILLNFLPDLSRLAPVTFAANSLQSIGLVIVMWYILPDPYSTSLNAYTTTIQKLPLYFGTAMYAFEGIGVILYIENSMATPRDFGGLTGVLNTGMTIVAALYIAVGFFGYLKYGNDIKSSITFNLPQGNLSEAVRLMFALAIFLSYPLQFQVPFSIIWPFTRRKLDLQRFSNGAQYALNLALRAVLVLMTFILALAIPMLHLFISLVGAFASSTLALIFPPVIELAIIWDSDISQRKFLAILIKDVFLILLGLIGFFFGTYSSVMEIAYCFKNMNETSCEV